MSEAFRLPGEGHESVSAEEKNPTGTVYPVWILT